jgi:GT2 family glycosyltransferase
MSPTVSVIIPHFHDLRSLAACLDALERQTYPADEFEVIVSDNNSPEGEAAVRQTVAGRARVTITAEPGAGPARNGGVRLARGRLLAFTDCDCIPEPDWLREGVAALQTHDFVGGRMKVLVADPAKLSAVEAFECAFAFDNEAYVLRKGFTVTANLFCPRAVFDAVGGFEVNVSEDIEWSHRARAAGYRIGYAARAVVGHPARRTWEQLIRKWRRMNTEQFGLYRRRRLGRLVWFARACLLPASALYHGYRALGSRDLRSPGQRLGALAVLFGVRSWRCADALRLLVASWRAPVMTR